MKYFLTLVTVLLLAPLSSGDPPELRTTPLVLAKGGTTDEPAIFDGKGMAIDLGTEVSGHDWKKEGDLWTSSGPLLDREPVIAGQTAGLFVGEIPITIPRDLEAEKLHPDRKSRCYFAPDQLGPGQMRYDEHGSVGFRWPTGIEPGSAKVILPGAPGVNCVSIACSHIVIRNVTTKYAGNDGFNIHGHHVGIRLENVEALSNADEGISAHDDVEMEVFGAEVAWNGSVAGGVADVNRCVTSYRDCTVHDNAGAAFFFSGKSHTVADTLVYNQMRDFSVRNGTKVKCEHIEWRRPRKTKL